MYTYITRGEGGHQAVSNWDVCSSSALSNLWPLTSSLQNRMLYFFSEDE